MPTVLQANGWRLYFYAREGNEPLHIHAVKAGMDCKFWLNETSFSVELANAQGLGPSDLRQVRKIVYLNFEQIEAAWQEFNQRKSP